MATRKNSASEAVSTLNRSNVAKEKATAVKTFIAPELIEESEMEQVILSESNTVELVGIEESNEAPLSDEFALVDNGTIEVTADHSVFTKPYYTTITMSITEALVLSPREVLMAKEVSTIEATAFTDRLSAVRSIIRKINKKGERAYTAILKDKTLLVWRTK